MRLLQMKSKPMPDKVARTHVWYNPPEPLKLRMDGFTAQPGTVFMTVGDGSVLICIGNSYTKPEATPKPRRKARRKK